MAIIGATTIGKANGARSTEGHGTTAFACRRVLEALVAGGATRADEGATVAATRRHAIPRGGLRASAIRRAVRRTVARRAVGAKEAVQARPVALAVVGLS